ncbi:MAG: N-acetyltransferase family protein [Pseudomonadota bacterium]
MGLQTTSETPPDTSVKVPDMIDHIVAVPPKHADTQAAGTATEQPLMSAIMVRHATDADLSDIAAIYHHHVLQSCATFEETPPTLADLKERMVSVTARGLPFLVALLNDCVVGFAYAAPYRPRSAARFTVEDSIYIDETLAGRGIGRVLMAELIAKCASVGVRQMIAMVGDSANTRSIHLHQRMGFQIEAVLKDIGFKHGRWIDMVLMKRQIGAGPSSAPNSSSHSRAF